MTGRTVIDNLDNVKIDEELRDLLPPLTPDEHQKLEESILKNGVLDPFKVWGDEKTGEKYLIDGHNRKTICDKHNIKINYWNIQYFDSGTFKNKEEVIAWIIENQLGRRNLSDADRYEIVQKYKPLFESKAKANKSANGGDKKAELSDLSKPIKKINSRKELAKMVGVSEGTYAKLDKVMKSDNEEIKKKVRADEISIDAAYKKVKSKVDKQQTFSSDEVNVEFNPEKDIENIDINTKFSKAVDKITSNLALGKWDLIKVLDNYTSDISMKKVIEVSKMSVKEQSKFFKDINNGILENFLKYEEPKNTSDCDKIIEDIDKNIADLIEHKADLFILRQQKFDETPDTDLHCEVEEHGKDNYLGIDYNFLFYLVKGDNKRLGIELSAYVMNSNKNINEHFELQMKIKKFSLLEKNILLSKIFETQKIYLEQEEIRKQEEEQRNKEWNEKFKKASNKTSEAFNDLQNSLNEYALFQTIKSNPEHEKMVKEIIALGYKAIAKKYHPDITKDDGSKMQIVNQIKDLFDKIIA